MRQVCARRGWDGIEEDALHDRARVGTTHVWILLVVDAKKMADKSPQVYESLLVARSQWDAHRALDAFEEEGRRTQESTHQLQLVDGSSELG